MLDKRLVGVAANRRRVWRRGHDARPCGGDHIARASRQLRSFRLSLDGWRPSQPQLDLPQGADAGLGMDLVLRQHHRRRADPLDDRAHERPDARARSAAPAARRASRAPPARPARRARSAAARWAPSPAGARRPGRRSRRRRPAPRPATAARIGTKPPSAVQALLIWRARRARTCSVISSGALGHAQGLGDRLEDARQVADRDALGQQALQHALDAGRGDPRRDQLAHELLVLAAAGRPGASGSRRRSADRPGCRARPRSDGW